MKDFCVITFMAMNQKHLDPPTFIAAAADIALSDNTLPVVESPCQIILLGHQISLTRLSPHIILRNILGRLESPGWSPH